MRRVGLVVVCALLSLAASCPGPGPGPEPTPTPPVPTPTPTPPIPDARTFVYPELLLRAAPGGGFEHNGQRVKLNGFSECCDAITPAVKGANVRKPRPIYPHRVVAPGRQVLGQPLPSRWPSIGKETMDYVHPYGVRRAQFRMIDYRADADHEVAWQDIGGPYVPGTLNFNEPWWEEHRKLALHAASLGWNIEANYDSWWKKYCKQNGWQHCMWPEADTRSFGVEVTPEHRRFGRKMVETLGCIGSITWGVGNEEALVPGARPDFFAELAENFRQAEKDYPCTDPQGQSVVVVHMISNNAPEWAGTWSYDIATTHTRAPLTQEIAGKPTELNEFNPGWAPKQWHSIKCDAEAKGLEVWLWRNGSSDSELAEMLRLLKQGCGGPQECFAPDGDDPLWGANVVGPTDRRDEVDAAKAAVPEACGSIPPHEGAFPTLAALAQELRNKGVCATGPWGDALAVQEESDPRKYSEWHAVRYSDGCYAENPDVLPKFIWTYNGTPPVPPGTGCGSPTPPAVMQWNVKEHTKGPNRTVVDSTPLVGPASYCASIGFTDGRSRCPVRQEGAPDRQACESLSVGVPVWSGVGDQSPENPYQAWVPRGVSGTATVCSSKAPATCGSVEVTP